MCILGREIVSRLTGECRPVFRPTDEWSGRLSYIHNPQALGIIITIIIILASSWLSSPSELCSSSYSINCHCTPNPRCFLAYRPTISTHKIVTVKTKIPKSKIFIDTWFSLFFCPFSPFCPNVPCPPFLEPKPLLTDYRTTAIFIIITNIIIVFSSDQDQSALIITAVMPSVLFVLSSPSWWMTGCEYRYFWWMEGRRIRWWLMNDPLPIGAGLGTT